MGVPAGAMTMCGPTSRYFAGRREVQMSGGSTTWSSRLTIQGMSVMSGLLEGDGSRDGGAVERSAGAVGVADHRVLRAAVVPDEEVAFLPPVPPGVLGLVELRVQQVEQR